MENKDLKLAFEKLKKQSDTYGPLFGYYEGDQPLVYLTKRLREIFSDLDAYFAENWCSVVIDAARDRINLKKIEIKGVNGKAFKDLWEKLEMDLDSDEVHEAAMVAGEAFYIAWPDEDDNPDGYFNDPRMCTIQYDAEFPRKKSWAAKWWQGDDEKMYLTMYYPDRLEYYVSEAKFGDVKEASNLAPANPANAKNDYGEVPVFHFRLSRKPRSDLKNVIPLQNGINKLLADMMVTAEYLAYPQRYIISNAETQGKVKNAPNEILDLPAGDGIGQQTQVGQFSAADLETYLKAMNDLATAISSITRTPKHYFFSVGSNLSGEALIAMEAPLNKKAQDRVDRFAPTWKQVALFLMKIAGKDVKPDDVLVKFDQPETIQPETQSRTRAQNKQAGVALQSTLREEGKSDAEIAQYMSDLDDEKKRDANLAQVYLDAARKKFDAGDPTQSGSSDTPVEKVTP